MDNDTETTRHTTSKIRFSWPIVTWWGKKGKYYYVAYSAMWDIGSLQKSHLFTDSWIAHCLELLQHMCLCACGCDRAKSPHRPSFFFFFLNGVLIFLPFFPLSPLGGQGDNVCANSPCVSCVSVQSGNDTGRVKKPQSDAISEYVYSGVKQNLNRPFRPCDFSIFKKNKQKPLPFMSWFAILPWNIPVRHTLDHPF